MKHMCSPKRLGFSVRCIMDYDPSLTLYYITIEPKNATVYGNETIQYSCKAFYFDGSMHDVTNDADWVINPDNYGNFSPGGEFFPSDVNGICTITASYKGISDKTNLTLHSGELFETGMVTDIDGNVYKTIKKSDQW